MATGLKPRTAAGYDQDVTSACERTLLTLLSAFGNLKDTLRLVGGLVPRYLTPATPPEVPVHAGTSDVDIVLNLEVLAVGNEYASLAQQLKARDFTRWVEEGKFASWRWRRKVNDHIEVVVELLRDAGDEEPGRTISVDGEKVSALTIKHARIVHDWYQQKEISAQLLDGDGLSVDIVRFADVPAFVILKALALDQRQERKDAADLIHVIRYSGSIKEVAALFVERISSEQHPEAMQDGLAALSRRFGDDEHGEGYEKVGAVAYARFYGEDDEDELVGRQRFAAGLVQGLLAEIKRQQAI
ncbi:hypothetical protein ACRAOD_24180 [Raoultella ornithinolytica]|uniref:hypothetical protein n=1 Tax=Raoultella TaxID=160674 RepID=UPI00096A6E08|nr:MULTISPECIES: hypothetical protein [Raoultella]MBD9721324.1 hypothetical protein [Raoultella sp. RLT01]MDL4581570.1 hypothetical protein [Raoultella ornithinolytica]MEB6439814.1 hypothetical protein [Raoultella ornithinolytica]